MNPLLFFCRRCHCVCLGCCHYCGFVVVVVVTSYCYSCHDVGVVAVYADCNVRVVGVDYTMAVVYCCRLCCCYCYCCC